MGVGGRATPVSVEMSNIPRELIAEDGENGWPRLTFKEEKIGKLCVDVRALLWIA